MAIKINIIKGRYFCEKIINFFDLNTKEKIKKGRNNAELVARTGSFELTDNNKTIIVKDRAKNILK